MLANELKRVIDDYTARKIGNDDFRDIVFWFASNHPEKIFRREGYNPTLTILLGQRRLDLLKLLLEGYQYPQFRGVK